jgi:glycerol-3-phosphate O-acyltransferase/dihydroxyacetone phosphate acyltransferase
MQILVRLAGLLMIRVFYRAIALVHRERVPAAGPVVVVANHPNGLLDPLVARVALDRPMAFLGKSTVFGNPFGRLAMGAFGVIPVYRPRDGEDTSKNEATFARCREHLAAGGWLMLFPEGTSHSETTLLPLRTGAARIILSGAPADVQVLPLGLVFEDKTTFRSRVSVHVGRPIDCAAFRSIGDERAAVRQLTDAIAAGVSDAMLEASDAEMWNGFLAVAAWTDDQPEPSMERLTARAKTLEAGYRRLAAADPQRAQEIVDRSRRFAHLLRAVGIDDPFALERPAVLRPARLVRFMLLATLLSPLAAAGWLLNVVPYQLVDWIARRPGPDVDVVGTIKAIAGLVFFPVFWLAEAITAGVLWGWQAALLTLLVAPVGGWVALRLLERLAARRQALGGWWMRMSRAELADTITRQRVQLAADVDAALRVS